MKIAYIRWKDACADEHDGPLEHNRLAVLEEVGWLIGENEESISIAMEVQEDAINPGRWRLHIPRVNIIDMKVFGVPRTRRPTNPSSS